ncbi:hypothetical protein [Cellulomonas uda]|uniref:Uncharacterized protein n=1 Tax=Cellulomonas uda TaxID=1714 RepID=A0A4Y3K7L5_CELUD|nr:hypothetical protein [Cellulomonas uda]NII67826.1 hypothetical protein [Cellulomonas uda]GEA79927.1 hypothetical protein CUD01_03710 [Cellulomonas uda]
MTASPGQPDDVTLAVVAARLADVREEMRGMRSDLASHRAELVPRGEWEQRNRHVDSRFQEHGREIGTLRTAIETKTSDVDLKIATAVSSAVGTVKEQLAEVKQTAAAAEQRAESRRAPWWAIATSLAGIASLGVVLVEKIAT